MNLAVDVGNSCIKLAYFENSRQVMELTTQPADLKKIKSFLGRVKTFDSIIFSSVVKETGGLKKILRTKTKKFIELQFKLRLPLHIKYETPHTLGHDRIANAAGAVFLFPGKPTLVIDAGSCLKFDFTDAKRNFMGGAISPGLNMRYKALHHFTARLPLLSPAEEFPVMGINTHESIISGVQNGMINEISGVITQYKKKYKSVKVILTGGDWPFFVNHLKNPIFVAPNLTLLGLNEILKYQTNNA